MDADTLAALNRDLAAIVGDADGVPSDDIDPGWAFAAWPQAFQSVLVDPGIQRLCGSALAAIPILDTPRLPTVGQGDPVGLCARKTRVRQVGCGLAIADTDHRRTIHFVAGSHKQRPDTFWRSGTMEHAALTAAGLAVATCSLSVDDVLIWYTDMITDIARMPGFPRITYSNSLFGRRTVTEPLTRPLRETLIDALEPVNDRTRLALL